MDVDRYRQRDRDKEQVINSHSPVSANRPHSKTFKPNDLDISQT